MPRLKLTEAERADYKKKKEAFNEEARANFDDPSWRREQAAVMTEIIYRGFEHENLIEQMSDTDTVDFTDRVTVKEVRGLQAFWVARGGTIQTSALRQNVIEVPRMTIGFKVEEFIDKILTNFSDTQANLIDLGIQRMDAKVNLAFLKILQRALPIGGPYTISGVGLPLAALNEAITEVRDESESDEVVIVGRATMTHQIMNGLTGNGTNSDFLLETNEQILATGMLGTYRGAKVITLRNFKDDTNTPFFPANELYVISPDASKTAFFGTLRPKEELTFEDYWKYSARRDVGYLVHRPQRVRRIVDTSRAAYTSIPGD